MSEKGGGSVNVKTITSKDIAAFRVHLELEEKSAATIEKYIRDVNRFYEFSKGNALTKKTVINYKNQMIASGYAIRSINSVIASVNSLFGFLEWNDLKIKSMKVQKGAFVSENAELTKAEYIRLINSAQKSGNERLEMLMQTICATGIRVSELKYVTVKAVMDGSVVVSCKAKSRVVFLVKSLRKKLLGYIKKHQITDGSVFITKNKTPIDRTNIWREMKRICKAAGVDASKVYPHNLRHLFARMFYSVEKDIVKLADILGHSSINTTRIYTISTGREHLKKLEKMNLII